MSAPKTASGQRDVPSRSRAAHCQTVDPRSPWTFSPLVYALVFLTAGASAYWRGGKDQGPRPAPTASPTAVVHLEAPTQGGGAAADSLDPKDVARQITAQVDDTAVGERLRIEVAGPTPLGQRSVAIQATAVDATRGGQQVNRLAQWYAEKYRTDWKASAEAAYRRARELVARAEQAHQAARAELESYLQRQAQAAGEAAERIRAARPARPVAPPVAKVAPPAAAELSDNPDWVDANRQLKILQQRRADLLVDRTPLHPAVQEVENRIEQLQQRVGSLPRHQPGQTEPQQKGPAVNPQPMPQPEVTAESVPQVDPQQLKRLQQAVDATGRAWQEALERERTAWQQSLRQPQIEIELASLAGGLGRSALPWMSLLAALATGLTSVVGLALISAGAGIEPVLTSVDQVEAALSVPVVGVVPGQSTEESAARPGRQRLVRLLLVLGGLLVLAGCVTLMVILPPV